MNSGTLATSQSRKATVGTNSKREVPQSHKKYHKCTCYGHEEGLPDYKQLSIPRTNNYYAATGGCPCIPRAAAHPGSWRLKEAQMRSCTHNCGTGCVHTNSTTSSKCCTHTGHQYGWKCGPHSVKAQNTAAAGKCDTFGNMGFKSTSRAYQPNSDSISDLSSVSPQKLEDLEALILEEYQARRLVESDVRDLKTIQQSGTADTYRQERHIEAQRQLMSQATEPELNELLRDIRRIVDRPLNQTNMDLLRRILRRQEMLQRQREYHANKKFNTSTRAEP